MLDWRFVLYWIFFSLVNAIKMGFKVAGYYLYNGKAPFSRADFLKYIFIVGKRDAYQLYFEKLHLFIANGKGNFGLSLLKHQEFIDYTQKRINSKAKKLKLKGLIRYSLKEAINGCNFIIMVAKKRPLRYIQFWTEAKKLYFDFAGMKTNKLGKYYLDILCLLEDMGYKKGEFHDENKYELQTSAGGIYIDVDMGNDVEKATELSYRIFKEIYKVEEVRVKVE